MLFGNAFLSGLSLAAIALFRPDTPHALILAVLLIGGFFRSLQFTSINTLGYADIDQQHMSRATSFASMAQQLSLSAGVATGAIILHVTMAARGGGALAAADFAARVPGRRRLRHAVGAGLSAAAAQTPAPRSAAHAARGPAQER